MDAISECPCRFLIGYRDGDTQNGVLCDTFSAEHHCKKCGFNPAVAQKRLEKIVGSKKSGELIALSVTLSRKWRKEHAV